MKPAKFGNIYESLISIFCLGLDSLVKVQRQTREKTTDQVVPAFSMDIAFNNVEVGSKKYFDLLATANYVEPKCLLLDISNTDVLVFSSLKQLSYFKETDVPFFPLQININKSIVGEQLQSEACVFKLGALIMRVNDNHFFSIIFESNTVKIWDNNDKFGTMEYFDFIENRVKKQPKKWNPIAGFYYIVK
jgi:hypothetical protein